MIWAISLFYGLTDILEFSFESTSGIESWVSRNNYPKHKELFWYLTFTVVVPLLVFLGHIIHRYLIKQIPKIFINLSYLFLLYQFIPLYKIDSELCYSTSFIVLLCFFLINTFFFIIFLIKNNKDNHHIENLSFYDNDSLKTEISSPQSMSLAKKCAILIKFLFLLIMLPTYIYCERYVPNIYRGVDLFHEGEFLTPLFEFWNGSIPYKDIYLQHGLFHNLGIPWLGATLFGYSHASVRAIQVIFDPFAWIGAYIFICAITNFRILPAVCFAYFCAISHIDIQERSFIGLIGIAFLAIYIRTNFKHSSLIFFNGLLTLLSLMHSVEVGFYTMTSSFVLLCYLQILNKLKHIKLKRNIIFIYLLGTLVGIAPFIIYFILNDALIFFIDNIHTQVRYQLEVWGREFPNVINTINKFKNDSNVNLNDWLFSMDVSLIYTPILLCFTGVVLAHFAHKNTIFANKNFICLILLFITCLFFFRTNLGRSDFGHFTYNFMIALCIITYATYYFSDKTIVSTMTKKWFRVIPYFSLCALTIYLPFHWFEIRKPKNFDHRKEQAQLKKLFPLPDNQKIMPSHHYYKIQQLQSFFQEHTSNNDTIYDYSNQSGILFYINRKSSHRYFMPVYAVLKDHQLEVINSLESKKTKYILFRSKHYFRNVDGFPTIQRTPTLLEYITNHYKKLDTIGGIEVYSRNSD